MSSFVLNLSNSTSNSSYDENIGGFPFILSYLNIFVPYSLILIIAIIVGVVGKFEKLILIKNIFIFQLKILRYFKFFFKLRKCIDYSRCFDQ